MQILHGWSVQLFRQNRRSYCRHAHSSSLLKIWFWSFIYLNKSSMDFCGIGFLSNEKTDHTFHLKYSVKDKARVAMIQSSLKSITKRDIKVQKRFSSWFVHRILCYVEGVLTLERIAFGLTTEVLRPNTCYVEDCCKTWISFKKYNQRLDKEMKNFLLKKLSF